jgi:hypothetical protein
VQDARWPSQIVCGDGSERRIENTQPLRGWVIEIAANP